ncbi:zinc ABC transporter ATP-binding protein AztA [Actinomycetes bacterium KLBMP 9759]
MVDEPAAVVIRDLVAAHSRHPVLHRITARLPRGRTTAVVGPNGAGKSTLLDVLAGVRAPVSGSVERESPRRPAYVVQRSTADDTFPITVREAVAMGRWAHRRPWRRSTTRDRAVVDELLAQLHLDGLTGRRLGELSGGQRQRVLVAQGLAQEAELLLLDEPAAGLDQESQQLIEAALARTVARGTTAVRVTHDPHVAGRADHCLLLGAGRLVAAGDPTTVLTPAPPDQALPRGRSRTSW